MMTTDMGHQRVLNRIRILAFEWERRNALMAGETPSRAVLFAFRAAEGVEEILHGREFEVITDDQGRPL